MTAGKQTDPATGGVGSLRPVSPDAYRFRTGRVGLVLEAVLLVGLGIWGPIADSTDAGGDPAGAQVAVLHLTTPHAVVLLGTGLLGLACSRRRRSALVFAAAQTVGYLVLFAIGVTAATRGVPTALGFDTADAVLHGALMATGLGLVMWLAGHTLEGRWWVPRRRSRPAPGPGEPSPRQVSEPDTTETPTP